MFYILLKLDWLCQVDPYTGEIIDQLAVPSSENLWQVCINQTGIPLIRSTENIIFEIQNYALPGVSLDFSYAEAMDKFIVPIPGPDKICVFDPLIIGINTYPKTANSESISVFPNPANSIIQIRPLAPGVRSSIFIYDLFGCKQDEVEISKGQTLTNIDVSSYPAGIYIAVLNNGSGIIGNRKFVVAR